MGADRPVENALTALRAEIRSLLPHGWVFYGPIRRRDGTWTVGARGRGANHGGRLDQIESSDPDLATAFAGLASKIRAKLLPPDPA